MPTAVSSPLRRRRQPRRPGPGRVHVELPGAGRPVRSRSAQSLGQLSVRRLASFKYLNYRQYQQGGALAKARSWSTIYLRADESASSPRRAENTAVLNMQELYPGVYNQTYAHLQPVRLDAQFGVWGDAYLQGDIGLLASLRPRRRSTAGGEIRLVQPIDSQAGFYRRIRLQRDPRRRRLHAVFGLQMGNFIKPKEFANVKLPCRWTSLASVTSS